MQKIIIVGATSAIAEAVARRYAIRATAIHLVGRNLQRLDDIAADLRLRGAHAVTIDTLDITDLSAHEAMLETAANRLGGMDVVLIAHGTLPDQHSCENDTSLALREFTINGTSTIALCNRLAPRLKSGASLAVISSVAGDRGRSSNYLYGSAKAAVSTYLSGMGQRLRPLGVNVLIIKPGFVDTPMTAAFKKGALWASADTVARGIVRAIDRRRPLAYLPGFWWLIMLVIKNIPETIFRRIKL
ncbi:SDR family oxidoreductase|uniref:SDR family oxidoreductase n=1 Tax=Stenotrophomonas TaxID=40323 RepID=UPI0015D21985|nr:SDR family oxidoreductase [Stenotrophomonas sp. SbOxS2]NYT99521.1 SDR family oxidoreductase [Stenotrophomonas sp. SbOxS2]